jgi:hypothetical protein
MRQVMTLRAIKLSDEWANKSSIAPLHIIWFRFASHTGAEATK